MLKRNEKGGLTIQSLDLQIFLGDLYAVCKTEREVNWLMEELQSMTECIADERLEELEEVE